MRPTVTRSWVGRLFKPNDFTTLGETLKNCKRKIGGDMRIIDKRSDYYDNVLPYDKEGVVWVRKELVSNTTFNIGMGRSPHIDGDLGIKHNDLKTLFDIVRELPRHASVNDIKYTVCVVCGVAYVVFHINTYLGRPQDVVSSGTPSSFVKKWNSIDGHKNKQLFVDKDNSGQSLYYRYHMSFSDKTLDNWYNNHRTHPLYTKLHRTLNSPVFTLSGRFNTLKITVNPILKTIGTPTVLEPWFLYNEIDRYIGNEMADNPLDTFVMSDELKRDSKGMDKWSFKQRGPKKRKQKKLNKKG